MDAENRIIPIVEDDQGEGFKDPLDVFDIKKMEEESVVEKLKQRMNRLADMEKHSRNTGR